MHVTDWSCHDDHMFMNAYCIVVFRNEQLKITMIIKEAQKEKENQIFQFRLRMIITCPTYSY